MNKKSKSVNENEPIAANESEFHSLMKERYNKWRVGLHPEDRLDYNDFILEHGNDVCFGYRILTDDSEVNYYRLEKN